MQINDLSTGVVQRRTSDSLEDAAFNGTTQGTYDQWLCSTSSWPAESSPPEVHGVPDYPLAAIIIAGPIVLDFDSTAATVIAVAFGAGATVLAVGTAWPDWDRARHPAALSRRTSS
jgi:hypothetical protein